MAAIFAQVNGMLLHAAFVKSVDGGLNIVCNVLTMIKHTDLHPDSQLIEELGGATKLAERLGYQARGGIQRIQNWKTRGIPAEVKLEHPELFLTDLIDRARATDDTQPPVGTVKGSDKLSKMVA
ncbi:hypothetical protein [Paraburkholderia sp.]|uniref:hypothetical protein n=1 Tax=Paraburkholderia sp. TaxID=1926495 RepID=UPI00239DE8D5|nr:hypothetical protein [Paraburkholderia sp.]MDE1179468.1 hypothetical protein [Paraburkholderia sp.]